MQTILDGYGVRIGSIPAYIDIGMREDENIIIVGASGSGKTTFAKTLLRGILKADIPVIACIVDQRNEYLREIGDAGLSVLDLPPAEPSTGETDRKADAAGNRKRHPRAVFHANTRHAGKPDVLGRQVGAALTYMSKASSEVFKILLVEDTSDEISTALDKIDQQKWPTNLLCILTATHVSRSEMLMEYAKGADIRVITGKPHKWGEAALAAMHLNESDLEGLDRHRALVAVDDRNAIVEVAR